MPESVDRMFKDFCDTLIECEIVRDGKTILKLMGMLNEENGKEYIMFKYGDDVRVGDVIYSEHGNDIVREVRIGNYNGNPDAIEAYL
jgi:hypothetical protein